MLVARVLLYLTFLAWLTAVCLPYVDGELFSATLNNFLGTEPVILRNMGPHHSIKTEYLAFWLNGESRSGIGEATSGRAFQGPGTLPLTLFALPQNPTL